MLQTCRKTLLYGLFIAISGQCIVAPAIAGSIHNRHHRYTEFARLGAYRGYAHVIQCVAFAKQDAGIDISGNARDWWSNAAGIYDRGQRPEIGSVLSFRANGRMPLGHVAVVASLGDSRTITIDQAHWNSRGITRDIEVKDVSEDNDWSAVRVQLSQGGAFGSIYSTHGFIYARPDRGVVVEASVSAPAALPPLPRRGVRVRTEVAELPVASRGLDLSLNGIASDAPDRAFR